MLLAAPPRRLHTPVHEDVADADGVRGVEARRQISDDPASVGVGQQDVVVLREEPHGRGYVLVGDLTVRDIEQLAPDSSVQVRSLGPRRSKTSRSLVRRVHVAKSATVAGPKAVRYRSRSASSAEAVAGLAEPVLGGHVGDRAAARPQPSRRRLHQRHGVAARERQGRGVVLGEALGEGGPELGDRHGLHQQVTGEGADRAEVELGQGRLVLRVPRHLLVEHGLEQVAHPQGIVGGEQVDRASHRHHPHQRAIEEGLLEVGRLEAVHAGPQREVGIAGLLSLHPHEVLHHGNRTRASALEEVLAGEERAPERSRREDRHGVQSGHGDSVRAVIVFVHGVPETAAIWDGIRSRIDRPSVALALPGFGNPRPAGFAATKDAYLEWLLDELDAVGEPVDLVGHDWGAIITAHIASAYGDRLRSYAFDVGNVSHPDYVWHPFAQIWQTPGEGEKFFEAQASNTVEERAAGLGGLGVPPEAAMEMAAAADADMNSCILDLYRSATPNPHHEWGPLAPSPAAGLVLHATGDPFSDERMAREVATALGAGFDTIEGTGHFWPYQAPDAGAEVLQTFWYQVD